jgi:hypothetical protein
MPAEADNHRQTHTCKQEPGFQVHLHKVQGQEAKLSTEWHRLFRPVLTPAVTRFFGIFQ